MIVLDENILISQRAQLLQWRIAAKHLEYDLGKEGMQDESIIPYLLTLTRPTLFTMDEGFYRRRQNHRKYCVVYLNVDDREAARFIRAFLRHKDFRTQAARLGCVIRVTPANISVWRLHAEREVTIAW